MIKAVLLDFYGTLVHEDDKNVTEISERIARSAGAETTASEVGDYWWQRLSAMFRTCHGDGFVKQRTMNEISLLETIEHFNSSVRMDELSDILYEYWVRPPLFDETRAFLDALTVPTCVVSNIDRSDIESAIQYNRLSFAHVITSEDARSYKPRTELFEMALGQLGLEPNDVLHVGDSLSSDVVGAKNAGIPVAWINRKSKKLSPQYAPEHVVTGLRELIGILK